ncbi:MAG TPA: VWA domain-containing protein [Candidatus Limnocylindrales bacterium]|nr:VWA domain-containing protein [Candidatus Limnocylindrales bacterium]
MTIPRDPNDPAIVRAPWGPEVDGRRLLAESVGFGRALRAAGLATDLGAAVDFARALTLVDLGEREFVRAAGQAVFVRRRDDREVYDRVFARWWRRRQRKRPRTDEPTSAADDETLQDQEAGVATPTGDEGTIGDDSNTIDGIPMPIGADEDDGAEFDGVIAAPTAYSSSELLRHRDFDRMTAAELRDAERLVDLLEPRLELRRTRRYELHHHGRLLAPRTMLRRNIATGGQFTEWVWRRATKRPRQIVVLCDISGSMERHSRLLLRFVQALAAASTVKTESFVFGTRLTRVTRLLKDRDRDRALARVADSVNDWAGGTRIGESFRDFNLHWARRSLRTSGVVIVVSDGWDRGDPALVASETARLRRNCHRLVWLNPLAGTPGYEPLAGGMRAALPYIDDFVPAGTVASLERLGEILAGVRSGDTRRGGEAAASADAGERHSAIVASMVDVPAPLGAGSVAPADARPLRGGGGGSTR